MRIGIVPMSAKPYHRGHHYLVTTAAEENDKVFLFASISKRIKPDQTPIYWEEMENIWENYLKKIMPENVEVIFTGGSYGGSPVRSVFEKLEGPEADAASGEKIEDVYTIYSDIEDTRNNYTVGRINRKTQLPPEASPAQKYFSSLLRGRHVKLAAEDNPKLVKRGDGAPDISGTEMRRKIGAEEEEGFKAGLPDHPNLSDTDKKSIYDMLSSRLQEGGQLYESTFRSTSVDEAIKRSFINSIIKGS